MGTRSIRFKAVERLPSVDECSCRVNAATAAIASCRRGTAPLSGSTGKRSRKPAHRVHPTTAALDAEPRESDSELT